MVGGLGRESDWLRRRGGLLEWKVWGVLEGEMGGQRGVLVVTCGYLRRYLWDCASWDCVSWDFCDLGFGDL